MKILMIYGAIILIVVVTLSLKIKHDMRHGKTIEIGNSPVAEVGDTVVEIKNLGGSAVYNEVLSKEQIKDNAETGKYPIGFEVINFALDRKLNKDEEIYSDVEFEKGTYRIYFREGHVGIIDNKILRGTTMSIVKRGGNK